MDLKAYVSDFGKKMIVPNLTSLFMSKEESKIEDPDVFDRRFKCSLIAYAVIEFVVIALVVYYSLTQ